MEGHAVSRTTAQRRGGARFWPLMVVGLLVGNVGICVFTIISATGDPGMAVEPDYYQKAMDWDERAAERRAAEKLGWIVHVGPGAGENPGMVIRVFDASGEPITGASVHAAVFHRARSGDADQIDLAETAPGVYAGGQTLDRSGLWEVRMTIERALEGETQRYVADRTLDIRASADSPPTQESTP